MSDKKARYLSTIKDIPKLCLLFICIMKAHTYTVIQTQEITAGKHIVDIRAS
jgi:hypothetical protein